MSGWARGGTESVAEHRTGAEGSKVEVRGRGKVSWGVRRWWVAVLYARSAHTVQYIMPFLYIILLNLMCDFEWKALLRLCAQMWKGVGNVKSVV